MATHSGTRPPSLVLRIDQSPTPAQAPACDRVVSDRVVRFDLFRLDTTQRRRRDTDGALIVPGRLARVGIQVYANEDGTETREYRPEEEVFAPEALASFDNLIVTDGHPAAGYVSVDTARSLWRGHITNPRRDGSWLLVDFIIVDQQLIELIESGSRSELSAGYFARLDHTPGTTPEGEAYDCIQRQIRGNHAAVIPAGWARAGRDARLADSRGQTPPGAGEEREMDEFTVIIGGRSVTLRGDAAARGLIEALVAEAQRVAEAERARDEARARADGAGAELADVRAQLLAREQAEAAAARAELEARARQLTGDARLDVSGSDRELRIRALARVGVQVCQDESDDYIRAAFDLRADEQARAGGATVRDAVTAISRGQAKGAKPRFGGLRAKRAAFLCLGGDR